MKILKKNWINTCIQEQRLDLIDGSCQTAELLCQHSMGVLTLSEPSSSDTKKGYEPELLAMIHYLTCHISVKVKQGCHCYLFSIAGVHQTHKIQDYYAYSVVYLIYSPPICLQRNTSWPSFRYDSHKLFTIHEKLLLMHIHHLHGHVFPKAKEKEREITIQDKPLLTQNSVAHGF